MTIIKNSEFRTVRRESANEVWQSEDGQFTWYVLKKYQKPENEKDNEYARWFCDVVTPFMPEGELGDVYIKDVKRNAIRIK